MSGRQIAQVISNLVRNAVQAMQASLEQSLRKLRCERIDVFLLHEADATDLNDDLRLALDAHVKKGSIGTWGLGSARPKIDRAIAGLHFPFPSSSSNGR